MHVPPGASLAGTASNPAHSTGQVKLLGYVAAHDVGRAINPRSVQGQIAGGVAQGLGMALLEEVVLADGVNLTGGFFQYLIPTATDVPDIEAVVIESGEGMGPFGARGIGEPPIGPPIAAVASAIADALGVRPATLPITPERVLKCLARSSSNTAATRRLLTAVPVAVVPRRYSGALHRPA